MLESAAPGYAVVGRSMQLLATIRQAESEGLKSFLKVEGISSLTHDDVRARPFRFPLDPPCEPQSVEITLRVDSPDFEPKLQTKKLSVSRERDSEVCTFLLTPQIGGELLLNLELLQGDVLVASQAVRTVAQVPTAQRAAGPNDLVSILSDPTTNGLRTVTGAAAGEVQAPMAPPDWPGESARESANSRQPSAVSIPSTPVARQSAAAPPPISAPQFAAPGTASKAGVPKAPSPPARPPGTRPVTPLLDIRQPFRTALLRNQSQAPPRFAPAHVKPMALAAGVLVVSLVLVTLHVVQSPPEQVQSPAVFTQPIMPPAMPSVPPPAAKRVYKPKAGRSMISPNLSREKVPIDGQSDPSSLTPLTIPDLSAAAHEMAISVAGHDDVRQSVLAEADKTSNLVRTLSSAQAELTIVTQPPAVEVFIDGKSYGPSPVHATLPPGDHTYMVKPPGMAPYQKSVSLKDGQVIMKTIILSTTVTTGIVEVHTTPPGAAVLADGSPVGGQTPTSFRLAVGSHALVISMPGHQPNQQHVTVSENRTIPINVDLAAQ
jgi:hypothetical protein